MSTDTTQSVEIPYDLIEAMRSLKAVRHVSHCDQMVEVPIFEIYATCPTCGEEFKVRSFGATAEIEDLFDTVFEWMTDPISRGIAEQRIRTIEEDT